MIDNRIKVGFCIAYDWYLLRHALPLVYTAADVIFLTLDKTRTSWSGEKFAIDEEAFKLFVQQIDKDNKVNVLEEDFYVSTLTPGQNEVRQRNRLAECMGTGGWHIQLDCDEYMTDFNGFVNYLKALPQRDRQRTNICCPLLTLYRQTEKGFLYILPQTPEQVEFIQVATQQPRYEFGRRNGDFNIYTNSYIIHQSWARSEEEIKSKLTNWGHRSDFDLEKYFVLWKNVNEDNYKTVHDFHPIQFSLWPSLNFLPAENIPAFLKAFSWKSFPYSSTDLRMKNSRFLAKVKKIKNLITG